MQHYPSDSAIFTSHPTVIRPQLLVFEMEWTHSPIRQTFDFGKSISTAEKSILNFVQPDFLCSF